MRNRFPFVVASFSFAFVVGCGGEATPATLAAGGNAASVTSGTGATTGTGTSTGTTMGAGTSSPAAAAWRWRTETSGVTDPLVGISGAAGNVWIAGSHSIMTGRGDGKWRVVKSGETDEYRAILVDGRDIYVAGMPCDGGICQGGMVTRSRDGGATWQRTTFTSAAAGLASDGRDVYLALDGEVRVASDDFASARAVPLPSARGIHAANGMLFTFGGIRTLSIRASRDAGTTWGSVYDGNGGSQSGHVDAMWSTRGSIFAAGNGASVPDSFGALVRSDDGGVTWSQLALPMERASSVWGASANDLYILGSQLLHTRDGATFSTVTLPAGTWQAVWGTSARDLYVIGFNGAVVHGTR